MVVVVAEVGVVEEGNGNLRLTRLNALWYLERLRICPRSDLEKKALPNTAMSMSYQTTMSSRWTFLHLPRQKDLPRNVPKLETMDLAMLHLSGQIPIPTLPSHVPTRAPARNGIWSS
jgi:hypothetical protein